MGLFRTESSRQVQQGRTPPDGQDDMSSDLKTEMDAAQPADVTAEKTEQHIDNKNPKFERPTGLRFALIILGICLALLCISLDRTIVATAVPQITSDFNSLQDAAWYGSSYLFATCAFQLLFGKLYTRLSLKWTFVASLVIFEVGSVVCGAAPSSVVLIIGRAIAGIGCAGVTAGALIIVAECVDVPDRPKYTGGVSGLMGLAFIASPTLGGAFTTSVSWRWCFYINLPLGAVTLLAVVFLLDLPAPAAPASLMTHLHHLDIPGTLLFIPSVSSLLLALQWGGTEYAWSDWRIILLFVVTGVVGIAWAVWQAYRGELATLPLRIVAQRSVAVGLAHISVVGGATFCVAYFVPIWFQAVQGLSPQQSGINYLSVSLPGAVFAVVSGILTSKTGYYVPSMYAGTLLLSLASGLLLRLPPSPPAPLSTWLPPLTLFGTGVGFAFQVALVAAQTVLAAAPADLALATSAMVLGQTLGGAVFLAAAQAGFANAVVQELRVRVPGLEPAVVWAAGAGGVGGLGGKVVVGVRECYNLGLRRVWIVVLVLSCVSGLGAVAMEWRSVKAVKTAGDEEVEETRGRLEVE